MNSHRTYLDISNSRKTIIRTFLLESNLSAFYFSDVFVCLSLYRKYYFVLPRFWFAITGCLCGRGSHTFSKMCSNSVALSGRFLLFSLIPSKNYSDFCKNCQISLIFGKKWYEIFNRETKVSKKFQTVLRYVSTEIRRYSKSFRKSLETL